MKICWIKNPTGRIFSEIFYYLGHWISFPMTYFDWAWVYPIYNKLMSISVDIQDWAGNEKPWIKEK